MPFQPRMVLSDRKSTRLNSSHVAISYAVFCLKKKNEIRDRHTQSPKHPSAAQSKRGCRQRAVSSELTVYALYDRGHCDFRKCLFFFFNDTATTEIYTLSLHDALPI